MLFAVFVPNDDIDVARRLLMHRSVQLGADWAHKYFNGVTHIIVRSDLDVTEAAKAFVLRAIPVSFGPRSLTATADGIITATTCSGA